MGKRLDRVRTGDEMRDADRARRETLMAAWQDAIGLDMPTTAAKAVQRPAVATALMALPHRYGRAPVTTLAYWLRKHRGHPHAGLVFFAKPGHAGVMGWYLTHERR